MTSPDSPVIEAHGLVKRFGRTLALDGLDLEVGEGQIHGFLGPNGAGKSTTIRVLLGLYRSERGQARVLGGGLGRDSPAINQQFFYVAGDFSLWPSLTGGQVLDALAALRGRRDRAREAELIERFDLDPSKRVRAYSKGNRQKVALVAALAAPTRLLILDEPTTGLDPLMEQVFAEEITRAASEGRTVLLSSHILAEVQRLCGAVTIVKAGRVVEQGDLAALRRLALTHVEVVGENGALAEIRDALTREGADCVITGSRLIAQVGRDRLPSALTAVGSHGVDDVVCQPASLEDLFLRHYQDAGGDQ